MVNSIKIIALSTLLTLITTTAHASSQTADFTSVGKLSNRTLNPYQEITDSSGNVTISGWADTTGDDDDEVEQATYIARYSGGWGITNNQHRDGHTADNYTGGDDYDFFLIDFTSSVNLTGASFGYLTSGNLGVSYAALDESKFNGSLAGLTWQQIVSNQYSSGSSSSAITRSANNTGYFINDDIGSSSRYWLVGAFNSVFGSVDTTIDAGGFKLASLSYTQRAAREVSEPGILLIFGLALVTLFVRRARKN